MIYKKVQSVNSTCHPSKLKTLLYKSQASPQAAGIYLPVTLHQAHPVGPYPPPLSLAIGDTHIPLPSVSRHELGVFLVCEGPANKDNVSQPRVLVQLQPVRPTVAALGFCIWLGSFVFLPVCFVGGRGRGGIPRKGKEISSTLLKTEIRNYQFGVTRSHSAWHPSAVLLWNDLALF